MPNQQKFDALLSFDDVKLHDCNDLNVMRRVALLVLTKNSDEILKIVDHDLDHAMYLFDNAVSYAEYLKELSALTYQTIARIMHVVGTDDEDKKEVSE